MPGWGVARVMRFTPVMYLVATALSSILCSYPWPDLREYHPDLPLGRPSHQTGTKVVLMVITAGQNFMQRVNGGL